MDSRRPTTHRQRSDRRPIHLARQAGTALLVALALVGGASACGGGGGGDGSGGSGPGAGFRLAVTPGDTATTLGTTAQFATTLTSTGGSGAVTLSVEGAPSGWQVEFSPSATPTLAANGTAAVTVTVRIPSNGAAAASGQALTIRAVQGSATHTQAVTLRVADEYVLPILAGAGTAGAHWGALGGTILLLRPGTRLTIRNDDATPHRVHTNAAISSFPHQTMSMAQGQSFSSVMSAGEDDVYCHDHPSGTGTIHVRVQ